MTEDLRALLIPPQEARLRSRFGLDDVPLKLIASGWHRLVVVAPDRIFAFPRHQGEVPILEREADVLSSLEVDFAPRLLGLHRDDGVSPYPFLELTRILGRPYDVVEASLSIEDLAECLEGLGRRSAQWHQVAVPSRFNPRPEHLDAPRISDAWTWPDKVPITAHLAAESLGPHVRDASARLWSEALVPIAKLEQTTVHGEVSDGQFLVAVLHRSDLTSGQRHSLAGLHQDFGRRHPAAAGLDVSFVPLRLVGTYGEDTLPFYRDGRFHQHGGGDVNMVMWHTLNERGIVVWGPPAADLVPSVDGEKLAENMRRNLAFLSRRMPAYVGSGTEDKVFGVLCLCRSLHTLRTREIADKASAARWALGEVEPRWRPLVARLDPLREW
jgi:Domain of unknown function (DUF4111)/Phosphotransferase enzyme family